MMTGRRKLLLSAGGALLAGGGAAAWYGKHSLPPRDPAAEERFRALQATALSGAGVRATSRIVETPPLRTHVLEAGAGEPVLLVHGGNSVAAGWTPLLARLQHRFHLYAPDRPGCGLTTQFNYSGVELRAHGAWLLGATLDALGLARAAVIGNSMGGFFALAFALAHPERVSKLLLIGEPAGSAAKSSLYHRLVGTRGVNTLLFATALRPPADAAAVRAGLRRGKLVVEARALEDDLARCLAAGAQLPGAVEAWLTMVERAFEPAGGALFARRNLVTHALRPELKNLRPPTLLLWGEQDPFGSPALGSELAALMPAGRCETLAGAAHLPWLDVPDLCAEKITEFLAR